jgi:hypothetical protein
MSDLAITAIFIGMFLLVGLAIGLVDLAASKKARNNAPDDAAWEDEQRAARDAKRNTP